jgi:hypothetical protein
MVAALLDQHVVVAPHATVPDIVRSGVKACAGSH